MTDRLLTPADIAEKLQVHEKTVHNWLKAGKLKGIKVERLWRVEPAELDAFLHQSKVDAQQN